MPEPGEFATGGSFVVVGAKFEQKVLAIIIAAMWSRIISNFGIPVRGKLVVGVRLAVVRSASSGASENLIDPESLGAMARKLRETLVDDVGRETDRAIQSMLRPGLWKRGSFCDDGLNGRGIILIPDCDQPFTVHVIAREIFASPVEFRGTCAQKFREAGFVRVHVTDAELKKSLLCVDLPGAGKLTEHIGAKFPKFCHLAVKLPGG